jgi:hypothetical protein
MLIGLLAIVGAMMCAGCNTYTLKGKVVRGDVSSIELVHEMDPRIKPQTAGGIPHVEVRVFRDPNTMNKHMSGRERTGNDGNFSINLGDFGAGWMQEQWLVQAALYGFENANYMGSLPSKNSKTRLLITLAPGTFTPSEESADYMQDYEQFK